MGVDACVARLRTVYAREGVVLATAVQPVISIIVQRVLALDYGGLRPALLLGIHRGLQFRAPPANTLLLQGLHQTPRLQLRAPLAKTALQVALQGGAPASSLAHKKQQEASARDRLGPHLPRLPSRVAGYLAHKKNLARFPCRVAVDPRGGAHAEELRGELEVGGGGVAGLSPLSAKARNWP